MHIWGIGWRNNRFGVAARVAAGAMTAAFLGGCAAPGPPLPPTLNLPQIVLAGGLSAARVGDEVKLRWTTPAQTTDKLEIKGAITAEICREIAGSSTAGKTPCSPVGRVTVTPGASDATDVLPAELLGAPAQLLVYRVQLVNAAGGTAGPSAAVYAAAGPGLRPVAGFAGETAKGGVVLRWRPEATGWVELERALLDPAPASPAPAGGLAGLMAEKQSAETRFRVGDGSSDPGGTIDRTAAIGHGYRYTAQRVIAVFVGGQTLEARSVPSAALEFTVRDVFPPEVPKGLVAAPGMAGDSATIDLSWEPDIEPRLAGYRVYRREEGSADWARVAPDLVAEPSYRDLKVTAGRTYSYRVTAVSTAGKESAPSGEVAEKAGR
jgi:hypothetical protein